VRQLSILRKPARSAPLVDVRSTDEFGAGYGPRTANIPFEQIEQRQGNPNSEQARVLICKAQNAGDP